MGVILTTGPSPGSRSSKQPPFPSLQLFSSEIPTPSERPSLVAFDRGVPMEFPCHPKAERICWIPFCTYNMCVFLVKLMSIQPPNFHAWIPKMVGFDRYLGLQTYWRHFGYAKIQGGILAGTSESSVNVLLDVERRPVWLVNICFCPILC